MRPEQPSPARQTQTHSHSSSLPREEQRQEQPHALEQQQQHQGNRQHQNAQQVQAPQQAQQQRRPTPSILPSPQNPPPPSTSPPPQPQTLPHYHRQLPPLSDTNPIASLTAALRGDDNPPHSNSRPFPNQAVTDLPSEPFHVRQRSEPTSFGYIPDHFFYSPPQSREQTPQTENAPGSNQSRGTNYRASTPYAFHSSTSPHRLDSSSSNSPANMSCAGPSVRKRPHNATINLDDSPEGKKRRTSAQHIDLVAAEEAQQKLLEKEHEDLIKRQREESRRALTMKDLTCMICLEPFTNMTVTHCGMFWTLFLNLTLLSDTDAITTGHLFCHECLSQALNASERASERNIGSCPACRKPIKRGTSAKTQIIPLALMKRSKQQADTSRNYDAA